MPTSAGADATVENQTGQVMEGPGLVNLPGAVGAQVCYTWQELKGECRLDP